MIHCNGWSEVTMEGVLHGMGRSTILLVLLRAHAATNYQLSLIDKTEKLYHCLRRYLRVPLSHCFFFIFFLKLNDLLLNRPCAWYYTSDFLFNYGSLKSGIASTTFC